ncbi:MAG: putative glycoside hydrolase [Candidatus Paceibacterota bacterium]
MVIPTKYNSPSANKKQIQTKEENVFKATHIKTPEIVKALYMTSWVAGTPSFRKKVIDIIDRTEINSIVIDIKDYTGKISFEVEDPFLKEVGSSENRIPDIKEFIKTLHDKNIYVIGRVSVFQDHELVSKRPELAVKRASNGAVWKDHKGISWLDAGSKEVWDYAVAIGKESYRIGFDELNFDYIRFPSDGNMNDISYPFSEEKILADKENGKTVIMENFFRYLSNKLKKETNAPISADLFGMVTTNSDDLNIGQVLERALPYFDFIAPMVYPSHYPKTFIGLSNPASYPYEVVKYSMDFAVKRAIALDNVGIATTTLPFNKTTSKSVKKLRPWLQDFDLGATYTAEMVRKQIQATYDSGLTSWMLWDAANTYTESALLKE